MNLAERLERIRELGSMTINTLDDVALYNSRLEVILASMTTDLLNIQIEQEKARTALKDFFGEVHTNG